MNIIEYVNSQKELLRKEVSNLKRPPVLLIIQVNDDPASHAYIRGKIKDGEEIGVVVRLLKLDKETSEEKLIAAIESANSDDCIDGVIVQMPLPRHIDEEKIKLAKHTDIINNI